MKRAFGWTGLLLAVVLLAAATVSWTSAVSLRLRDETGAPASGAYVRYHHYGSYINPVDAITYVARGSVIVRADEEGRVRIPGRLHVRSPLPLSTPPRVFIDDVYVPGLHSAVGPIAGGTSSAPGVFEFDGPRRLLTIRDASRDPDRWERSMRRLYECIRGTLTGSAATAEANDSQTGAYARELVQHLRTEHAAFLARYARTPRARPSAPGWASAEDRASWTKQMDASLAREPLWGPFIERTWRGNLAELDRFERMLQ